METANFIKPTSGETVVWNDCQFLTCSVLPVRMACNLHCPFCFSRTSISSLERDRRNWQNFDLDAYYRFALNRGATRLVVTGGGEPLLDPSSVILLVSVGSRYFKEIACFTNGTFLTYELSRRLADAGLTYLCFSRHAISDSECRDLMGPTTPCLDHFFEAAADIKVRATCVMLRDYIAGPAQVWKFVEALAVYGVVEFTFKHTYVAAATSLFQGSRQNAWARTHRAKERDPFAGLGRQLATLPWGPVIRAIGKYQVCYYYEPTPKWEQENRICRSVNLLSDGKIYASLEDAKSLLFELPTC